MTEQVQSAADTTQAPSSDAPNTAVAAGGAQDLDALLKEFETATESTTAEATPKAAPETTVDKIDPDTVLQAAKELEGWKRAQIQQATEKAVADAVKIAKGDLPVSDEIVEGFLEVMARKNPNLLKAFAQREAKPDAYKAVLGSVHAKLREQFESLPDRTATANREAVSALVRGSTTAPPRDETPDFSKMSDQEIQKWTASKRSSFR